ncbi:MAG: repressor LexA [Deltaproteobacteria bacterium]|nr:repressor LexA [Deltaproteobacteria bacterium]
MPINIEQAKEVIKNFFETHQRMPSYSEICELFQYKSKNAAYRLVQKLLDAGIVEKSKGGKLVPKQLGNRLRVLGSVQAGFPTPQEEDVLDTLSLDDYLVRDPAQSFLVRVFGDSMIDEGIRPDDLVVVERGRKAKSGDIVLANIDGEWTLKTYQMNKDGVCLVPGNPKYPILYPRQELTIGGVVVSVVRKIC